MPKVILAVFFSRGRPIYPSLICYNKAIFSLLLASVGIDIAGSQGLASAISKSSISSIGSQGLRSSKLKDLRLSYLLALEEGGF